MQQGRMTPLSKRTFQKNISGAMRKKDLSVRCRRLRQDDNGTHPTRWSDDVTRND